MVLYTHHSFLNRDGYVKPFFGLLINNMMLSDIETMLILVSFVLRRSSIKSAVVLFPLLGVTWLFGILALDRKTIAFQYLFAIFNSLQGFFIFIFHCLLNSEVRSVGYSVSRFSEMVWRSHKSPKLLFHEK